MSLNTGSLAYVVGWQLATIIALVAFIASVTLLVQIRAQHSRYGDTYGATLEWTVGLSLFSIASFAVTMLLWLDMPVLAA